MRKEIIIAIIIGLCLGLVVAFGIRSARLSLANRHQLSPTPAAIKSANSNSNHTIFITAPEPNTITDQEKITIIGTTSPYALISVISDADQIATSADDTGSFTANLNLDAGVNNLEIRSYNDQNELATTSFMVIYSTADLTATESSTLKP